jgi:hypothetical protein
MKIPVERHRVLRLTLLMLAGVSLACSLVAGPLPGRSPAAAPTTPQPGVMLPPVTPQAYSATAEPGTLSPGDGEPLDSVLVAELEQIEAQVRDLRGLTASHPMDRALLSPTQLRERVLNDFLAEYTPEEAEAESRLLWLLDLIPADYDLLDLYEQLYAEQVAGYYDDEAQRMFVVTDQGFGGPERLTYAHEYTHALQDQAFGLRTALAYSDEACQGEVDRCRAVSALAEGDATLLETQWLRTYATQEDLNQILVYMGSLGSPVLDSVPAYLQDDFLFPYEQGLEFAQHLYLSRRWSGIDSAYRLPPASTEQILHPERYPDDRPVHMDLPLGSSGLTAGWRLLDHGTLGEWSFRQALGQHMPEGDAATTAQGWGGDSYLLYGRDDRTSTALVFVAAWDSIRDAQEAFVGLRAYGDARFGKHQTLDSGTVWQSEAGAALLQRVSDQTLWILAPDLETADVLQRDLPMPAPHSLLPTDEPSP